ncbi:hypothetical protein ACLB2K_043998 [Fragaria x ananassa]
MDLVEFDLAALADIQNKIATSEGSDEEFEKETELQVILNESIRHQEILWREKSRLRWLSEGDRNSSYFHALCKVRRNRSSITLLRDGDQVLQDPHYIQNHIVDYYKNLFTKHAEYEDSGLVSKVIHSMVTLEENTMLTSVPLSEEIWAAVKSMDPDSASGPDGFNGYFFVSCWDVVGADVVKAVQYFFQHGYLAPSFNSGIIILIPKVDHADSIKQFRPIALTNFVFKIIPKIIAIRLASVASHIISPQQHSFVAGRNISDCILTTSECFNLLNSKCHGGNLTIKVDITKAFDTLSWDFLLHVLQAFGFDPIFVQWVRALLLSAKLSLLINGRTVGRNLSRIMRFFNEYGRVSGQVINKGKSQVFIGNSIHSKRHSISNFLGIPLGSAPFMYLGAPIFHGKPRASYFHQIVDKIRIKLSSWVSSFLSMAGHLQLIKSVIFSMLVYTFQVYEWPVSVVRKIEVWCRKFLWSGSIDKRGIPLVAWKSCCSPIAEGGLGLKQLVLLNRSLLLKRCWKIYTAQSEGCAFIRNRFSRRKSYAPYSIWPGVRQFWKTVQDNSQWLIGSGNGIYFWRDKFMGRPINEFFGSNVLMQDNSDLVSKYIDNGSWNLPPLLQLHYPALCGMINQVPVSEDPSVNDKLIWTSSASVSRLRILKCFGAPCRPRATPRVVEVNWIPPSLGWVKINSDGSWKHGEGVGGYGAIFRDYKGHFLGAFASNLEIPSSISAEIMAVIKAIELAWVRDWKHIWLEVDSSLVLDYIRRPSLVPWPLRVRWLNCLYRISKMNFKATHIFREGNRIADALTNQDREERDPFAFCKIIQQDRRGQEPGPENSRRL